MLRSNSRTASSSSPSWMSRIPSPCASRANGAPMSSAVSSIARSSHEQLIGDFAVAAPGRDEPQHFQFPRGKPQPFRLGDLGLTSSLGSGLDARGFTRPAEGDPGTPGEQGDVLAQRPGAKPVSQFGGTAQPGGG